MIGLVGMLPWIFALLAYLWLGASARNRRQIYLHIAYLMCAIATLAKGPAGVGLPVIVMFVFLLAQGQWRKLLPANAESAPGQGILARLVYRHPIELLLGVLVFAAIACPWYHAMLIKHGMGFWNEFIGDNYVHRAAGRHGDRGTFEYYVLQIGHGMYPWTGFIAASLVAALARLRGNDQRGKLRVFAVTWFLVMFVTMSLVNTKFHHYILPGLPALAILAGLFIDDLIARPTLADAGALALLGVPSVALAARDLAKFPARLLWLFDYDYVNAPNGGRPWPPGAEYDYGNRLAAWGIVVTAATAIFAIVALARAWRKARLTDEDCDAGSLPPAAVWALCLIPVAATAAAEIWQPPFDAGPHPLANGWILVGGLAGALLVVLLVGAAVARPASSDDRPRPGTIGLTASLALVGVVACLWTGWGLDRLLTDVSPHWSQKHVIASYYKLRSGPEEPLLAWQMYWRGENFYTKNVIYDHTVDQKEKTVFLGDHNADKMQEYFKSHPGRRIFFIVERTRFEALRALLPEGARASLHSVDDTNNKIYLGVAQL
jgi:4-amino-4-deoxy-L-arabinose transferase-like glycosyltransferase